MWVWNYFKFEKKCKNLLKENMKSVPKVEEVWKHEKVGKSVLKDKKVSNVC